MKTDTLRNYKNQVSLNFKHCGNDFSLDVPHYGKWLSIIRFLKKRGFDVKENAYYKEQYACLSKFHKIGFKKDVVLLMGINARSITVEFGNVQNLWKDMPQSFWSDPTDSRFTKLSYLEQKAVLLEIYKLMQHCAQFKLTLITEEYNLSPEEIIIRQNQENRHIHGDVECLEDIKKAITPDSYNWTNNSNDKNKKKIVCGETKYFYDHRTKRLVCGVVWHNINNMWWVICGGKLRNIAAHDLFDYEPGMPKRKPIDASYIEKLLNKFAEQKNYKKCVQIQEFHKLKN